MRSHSVQSRSKIIINADDFGWCSERDKGIIELFQKGCITSTTVLINGPNAIPALKEARKVDLPVGLHLNLTEGLPVKQNIENNSLIKLGLFQMKEDQMESMRTIFHGKFELPELIKEGKIEKEHVFKEIHAQVPCISGAIPFVPYI